MEKLSVPAAPVAPAINLDYYNVERNQDLALKLFNTYYRTHVNSGKLLDEVPSFFLVKPSVIGDASFITRSSDKLIMADCMHYATERNGYVGIIKHRNAKLQYYWLELIPMPFMLGDLINENNKSQFFYLLTQFVEYSKQNPKMYGNLMAEIDSDKDLALMLKEINKIGDQLKPLLKVHNIAQLISFNPNWPPTEVKKLLESLKGNDMEWCEVFYECLMYVMGRKSQD